MRHRPGAVHHQDPRPDQPQPPGRGQDAARAEQRRELGPRPLGGGRKLKNIYDRKKYLQNEDTWCLLKLFLVGIVIQM